MYFQKKLWEILNQEPEILEAINLAPEKQYPAYSNILEASTKYDSVYLVT